MPRAIKKAVVSNIGGPQRIGIVTGGGDCPGLNAMIRAVTKAAAKQGWETIGKLRTVPINGSLARTAVAMGICLGG